MMQRMGVGLAGAFLAMAFAAAGCTGGQEGTAAEEGRPAANAIAGAEEPAGVDARQRLKAIHPAIPLYAGARFRDDLTRRDTVMVRNRYGEGTEVYTLATNDSFPQVYHYYTTYLAQFRAFPARETYPREQENWRTLEVVLNEAMQDPFIPGAALQTRDKHVILQVAETEAEPKTVIRYIVAPGPPPAPAPITTAEGQPVTPPVAR